MNATPQLLLVDGSSYLYRAFHAMPDLRVTLPDGKAQATGAIRGMINMLASLRKDAPAPYAACVFDAKGPTFRDALYPDYKANRSPMPDDLRSQIELIHQVVADLGWPVLVVPGVEADDVIGTLAKTAAAQGLEVLISSGDKDLTQLVDAHITIVDTMNGKRRDLAGVHEEFGVPAHLMLDYQTLVGDSVDNVPGVDKVGPKTAVKWLTQYGNLQGVVANAANIGGVVGENLRKALDWLPKGRELLTIKTDCDLASVVPSLPQLDALSLKTPNVDALTTFYSTYGFKSLLKTLDGSSATSAPSNGGKVKSILANGTGAADSTNPTDMGDLFGDAPVPAQTITTQYETVLTQEALSRWLHVIEHAELTALDTETTSLDAMQARIVGISLCVAVGQAAYIPLAHDYAGAADQLPLTDVLAQLMPWFENPAKPKVGQHLKYDQHVLANHGIALRGVAHDTLLQSYVLEAHRPHGLESLALRHLGRQGLSYEDLCGKGAQQIPFSQVDIDKAAQYSCEDADLTLHVHQTLWPQIASNPKLAAVYTLELASSETLFRIERNGVLIDAPTLAAQSQALGVRIAQIEQEAHALAGQTFNIASPKQIGEIFFTKLGLPVVKKTPKGEPSTDEEVLEKLAEDFPLPAKILEFRGLAKLKNTYTDKLSQLANPQTGRVHTHYAQAVAVTGRLSSTDPNLQNIPIRTAEGRKVREAFVARDGWHIVSSDYSQIELRIMAHLSGDAAFMQAFRDGLDIHRATAAEVFGLAVDQVSSEQRRYAKAINFGLIYGMSAYGLARNLGIDNTAAKNYIERYFARYPGVKAYMDETRTSAKAKGYVETVMGRRLYLPEINSPNGPRRAGAERQAINAPMQGTAADLIKLAMNAVQRELDAQNRQCLMIMQVHDELVFEVPNGELEWIKTHIPRLMAGVATLNVPLVAEVGVGNNWDEAH